MFFTALPSAALLWSLKVLLGQTILYLISPPSFRAQFATVHFLTSFGGALQGAYVVYGALNFCIIASGFVLGICMAFYRRLRGMPISFSKVFAPFRRRQGERTKLFIDFIIITLLASMVAHYGTRILRYLNHKLEILDDVTITIAAVLGHLCLAIAMKLWSGSQTSVDQSATLPISAADSRYAIQDEDAEAFMKHESMDV